MEPDTSSLPPKTPPPDPAAAQGPDITTDSPATPPAPEAPQTIQEQMAAAAAAQSPAEPQVVPEQRPQAFISPTGGISEASKRLDTNVPPTQEEIDVANSDEAKAASAANSLTPRLYEGQRVTFVSGPEVGRMAYVVSVAYKDAIQEMIASHGGVNARFAEVECYILRTRDGRTDTLVATPDQIRPLDDIEGWGRGQI